MADFRTLEEIESLRDQKSKIMPGDRPSLVPPIEGGFAPDNVDLAALHGEAITSRQDETLSEPPAGRAHIGTITSKSGGKIIRKTKIKPKEEERDKPINISNDSGNKVSISVNYGDYLVLMDMLEKAASEHCMGSWLRLLRKLKAIEPEF